jgi:hypothetical protein
MWRNLLIHRTTQYSIPIPYSARLRAYEIFQSFHFAYDISHSYKPTLFYKLYLWLSVPARKNNDVEILFNILSTILMKPLL